MSISTIELAFYAIYRAGIRHNPGDKEKAYGQDFFPGLAAYGSALNGPFPPGEPEHSNLLSLIRERYPIVTDLRFNEAGERPIFQGTLSFTYPEGAQPYTDLLPYVIGELYTDSDATYWLPHESALEALGSLLDNILWIPLSPSPRIVGLFSWDYSRYTIDGTAYSIYRAIPVSSGGISGGMRRGGFH